MIGATTAPTTEDYGSNLETEKENKSWKTVTDGEMDDCVKGYAWGACTSLTLVPCLVMVRKMEKDMEW